MKTRILVSLLAGLGLAASIAATPGEPESVTTYGDPIVVGHGSARVYLEVRNGAPAELGVALSEAAFAGLPHDGAPGGMQMPDGHHTYDYVLEMPARNPTPYKFVGLGWNPVGHFPPGVFDQPHFDFHFYSMTREKWSTILPSDPEFGTKAERMPAPEFAPAGYRKLPGAVPLMGAHWVDPSSPELNGELFTRTFLYGSWDGEMTFAEPMITKAFLETKPDFRAPIAQPAKYAEPGYHPTEYRVYWHPGAKEYRVALAGMAE